ncbi:MAG: DUF2478 domain-containing protein [Ancalomicrobiaceae bacterium]|nr:DUF2478 domain-containing protein [Ancalomicrobiaceae bacterium]
MIPQPLGVVVHDQGAALEETLSEVRDRLKRDCPRIRLGGLLPRFGERYSNGKRSMWLDDLRVGDTIPLSQDLGAGSMSCCLDPNGIAVARVRLAEAVSAGIDILFVGRFAKEELAGHGVREEIALAVGSGVPALVAVERTIIPGWRDFAGADWTALPLDVGPILNWVVAVAGQMPLNK